VVVNNVAYFNLSGGTWNTLAQGINDGVLYSMDVAVDRTVNTSAVEPHHDGDDVPAVPLLVFAVGRYIHPSGDSQPFILCWNQTADQWVPLTNDLMPDDPDNNYLVVRFLNRTQTIYVGGSFAKIGSSVTLNGIASLSPDDTAWQPIDGGASYAPVIETIEFYELTNNQTALVVGGSFLFAGSDSQHNHNNIALWNGSHWIGLGRGVNGLDMPTPCDIRGARVTRIVVDQRRRRLVAAGKFTVASNLGNGTDVVGVNNIALFDFQSQWWYTGR
jgi:hypothetical protein